MRRLAFPAAVLLAALSAGSGFAQAPVAPAGSFDAAYAEWLARRGGNPAYVPWSHDEPPEVRAAAIAAYWAAHEGDYGPWSHGRPHHAVVGFGGTTPQLAGSDEFEARWLAECIAAGDIVVPFLQQRGQNDAGAPQLRRPAFFVFPVGTPAHAVEGVIRAYMTFYRWPDIEVDAAVGFYRTMTGIAP